MEPTTLPRLGSRVRIPSPAPKLSLKSKEIPPQGAGVFGSSVRNRARTCASIWGESWGPKRSPVPRLFAALPILGRPA
jgi:hypothetical protein